MGTLGYHPHVLRLMNMEVNLEIMGNHCVLGYMGRCGHLSLSFGLKRRRSLNDSPCEPPSSYLYPYIYVLRVMVEINSLREGEDTKEVWNVSITSDVCCGLNFVNHAFLWVAL